ncbi:unnamed protein product, partial [Prorocentrum cordatum]
RSALEASISLAPHGPPQEVACRKNESWKGRYDDEEEQEAEEEEPKHPDEGEAEEGDLVRFAPPPEPTKGGRDAPRARCRGGEGARAAAPSPPRRGLRGPLGAWATASTAAKQHSPALNVRPRRTKLARHPRPACAERPREGARLAARGPGVCCRRVPRAEAEAREATTRSRHSARGRPSLPRLRSAGASLLTLPREGRRPSLPRL